MPSLALRPVERSRASRLAARSRGALDRPLAHDAELTVALPTDGAVVLGAFQRAAEVAALLAPGDRVLQRGSGGAAARVGEGSIWVQLALARPDALVACAPDRLLNRYVRPVLRALTRTGALARYFDRDWISVDKRPAGLVGFAHDSASGRALVEVFLAVSTPFAIRDRASYLGKAPATLGELAPGVTAARLADAILEAFATSYEATTVVNLDAEDAGAARPADPAGVATAADLGADLAEDALRREPAWSATRPEAIGIVASGRDAAGRLRVGGELMVSRDARQHLEERLAALPSGVSAEGHGARADAVGRAIHESLRARGVALVGVRSLEALRDAVLEALGP